MAQTDPGVVSVSQAEVNMNKARWALAATVFFSMAMGVFIAIKAYADVEGDLRDIRASIDRLERDRWKDLLPGGVIVAGLLAAIGAVWVALQKTQRALLEEVKASANERATFKSALDVLARTGEESQEQRREAVAVIRDDIRTLKEEFQKKKDPDPHEEHSGTGRAPMRKR